MAEPVVTTSATVATKQTLFGAISAVMGGFWLAVGEHSEQIGIVIGVIGMGCAAHGAWTNHRRFKAEERARKLARESSQSQ